MEASAPDFALAHGFPMNMISVVDDKFCVVNPTEMIVKKKYNGLLLKQRYKVKDVNGKLLLQVDGPSLSIHKKRVMRDAQGSPILIMQEKVKMVSLRHRWRVHRGKSSDDKDVIFGVRRSHPMDMKPRLDVFMPGNTDEDVSNFQVVGSHTQKSCTIYKGDTIIAQVSDVFPSRNFSKWKESYKVKINEGVDYAFVVALLVILTVNDYI
ncbi:hypothetical protein HN51_049860 [Arachis hypogaea]|uniref:Protein LURP-one-related n=1 Tax=Arachis hypogaea TaxID=3818 RepID=A0A444YDP9_ARAHY|nr:protein LURP-one-related 15-like [Arachis ipaensis]XP_025667319.1 protein LURP-one-related 15 [Arachis hypogaea]QHN91487.1 Protein LURP-one-related [Arachis hypogaea]RYR00056.1 hypothetical protein Ahy_B07g088104 [Arachis hypogaea]